MAGRQTCPTAPCCAAARACASAAAPHSVCARSAARAVAAATVRCCHAQKLQAVERKAGAAAAQPELLSTHPLTQVCGATCVRVRAWAVGVWLPHTFLFASHHQPHTRTHTRVCTTTHPVLTSTHPCAPQHTHPSQAPTPQTHTSTGACATRACAAARGVRAPQPALQPPARCV
jgi:hypothetical protein